jgi:hypothetical protein
VALPLELGIPKDLARSRSRLLQTGKDLAEFRPSDAARSRLKGAHRDLVRACLRQAQRELRQLAAADRFEAAAAASDRLQTEWGGDAREAGLEAEFTQVQESYAFLAELARRAGQADPQGEAPASGPAGLPR